MENTGNSPVSVGIKLLLGQNFPPLGNLMYILGCLMNMDNGFVGCWAVIVMILTPINNLKTFV